MQIIKEASRYEDLDLYSTKSASKEYKKLSRSNKIHNNKMRGGRGGQQDNKHKTKTDGDTETQVGEDESRQGTDWLRGRERNDSTD